MELAVLTYQKEQKDIPSQVPNSQFIRSERPTGQFMKRNDQP